MVHVKWINGYINELQWFSSGGRGVDIYLKCVQLGGSLLSADFTYRVCNGVVWTNEHRHRCLISSKLAQAHTRWHQWEETEQFKFFQNLYMRAKLLQSYPALCDPMDYSPPGSSVLGISPGKDTGMGCRALLQGICPTQESNLQSPVSSALTGGFFTTRATWEAPSKGLLVLQMFTHSLAQVSEAGRAQYRTLPNAVLRGDVVKAVVGTRTEGSGRACNHYSSRNSWIRCKVIVRKSSVTAMDTLQKAVRGKRFSRFNCTRGHATRGGSHI